MPCTTDDSQSSASIASAVRPRRALLKKSPAEAGLRLNWLATSRLLALEFTPGRPSSSLAEASAAFVPFIEKLERAGSRRNAPPPPSWNRVLFKLVYGEVEEVVPGHAALMNVLWEMGRRPDLTMLLSQAVRVIPSLPSRPAAIGFAVQRVGNEQWAHWPIAAALEARIRTAVEQHFGDLYAQGADGFAPRWINMGREALITWQPGK